MLWKLFVKLWFGIVVVITAVCGTACLPGPTEEVPLVLSSVDDTEDMRATGYPDSRKIAADSRGNLFIAYRKKIRLVEETQYHIFVARSHDNGETWSVLNNDRPIANAGDYNQRVPSIAVDDNDVIHVVWYGNDARNGGENERQIKYVRSPDGGTSWSTWQNLVEISGYQDEDLWQEHPTILSQRQALYVVWQGLDADNQYSQTRFMHSLDGGLSWSQWRDINPDPATNFSRPALVATSDGVLYVFAYSNVAGVQQIVWGRSRDGGESWSSWTPIMATSGEQRHFSVAVSSSDEIHIVWRQGPVAEKGLAMIFYSVFDGRSFTTPSPVAPAPTAHQFFPSAALDENDNLFAIWMETVDISGFPVESPENGDLFYAVKGGTGWTASQRFTNSGQALYPSIAAVPQGVAAVWLERRSPSGGKIFYGTLPLLETAKK